MSAIAQVCGGAASQPGAPQLRPEESKLLDQLRGLPLHFICSGGMVEDECRRIGQGAFNRLKERFQEDSEFAGEELREILNTLQSDQPDGLLRAKNVGMAWRGVGDEQWQWPFQEEEPSPT